MGCYFRILLKLKVLSLLNSNYSRFHKTSPKSSLQLHWISVRFYEMGVTRCSSVIQVVLSSRKESELRGFFCECLPILGQTHSSYNVNIYILITYITYLLRKLLLSVRCIRGLDNNCVVFLSSF